MRLNDFTQWANQALEGGKFSPPHPPAEQVVILPLAATAGPAHARRGAARLR
jgi:ATP-dependent helicase/nuclease subunit B